MPTLDLLKTQIKSYPKNRQSNRQKPEIRTKAHQPTVLRSLQVVQHLDHQDLEHKHRIEWRSSAFAYVRIGQSQRIFRTLHPPNPEIFILNPSPPEINTYNIDRREKFSLFFKEF